MPGLSHCFVLLTVSAVGKQGRVVRMNVFEHRHSNAIVGNTVVAVPPGVVLVPLASADSWMTS